jgi:hypothetical protein
MWVLAKICEELKRKEHVFFTIWARLLCMMMMVMAMWQPS